MATIETILAAGRADYLLGRKAALRSIIWFGFGAHEVLSNGTTKEQTAYFDDLGAILRESGAVKSEVSTKRKQAKQIGEKFATLFGKELATSYRTEADFVQACFVAAQAAGASSVNRLVDWAVNGDPDATDKAKAAKEAERMAEKDAARAESLAAINNAPVVQMGFDEVPEPVQNLNPVMDQDQEPRAIDFVAIAQSLNDEQLAEMAQAIAAEMAARKAAQAEVKAA
ncbi:hypothetical protein [Pararhodobacter sp.]|uniref:hypothetical protein n=1 Tax=Pararhodobacter sp. TaxID=2127056 RepID=UPI002FDD4037